MCVGSMSFHPPLRPSIYPLPSPPQTQHASHTSSQPIVRLTKSTNHPPNHKNTILPPILTLKPCSIKNEFSRRPKETAEEKQIKKRGPPPRHNSVGSEIYPSQPYTPVRVTIQYIQNQNNTKTARNKKTEGMQNASPDRTLFCFQIDWPASLYCLICASD